jgi:hypothetical protein
MSFAMMEIQVLRKISRNNTVNDQGTSSDSDLEASRTLQIANVPFFGQAFIISENK